MLESDDEDSADEADERSTKRAKVIPGPSSAAGGKDGGKGEGEEVKAAAAFVQPELLSGATLKDYQLEGVAWMWSLFDQGISGILGEFLCS